MYPHSSNIRRTSWSIKIVDHSDVVGASPVGACSNYIFICDLTPDFNELDEGNCKPRRESFKFWDLVWLILEVWRYSVLLGFVCYIVSTLWVLVGSLHAFIHAKWRLFCSGLDRLIRLAVEIHFIMPLQSRSMASENKNLFVIKHWNKWDPVGAVITNIHLKFTLTHWPPRAMAVISVNTLRPRQNGRNFADDIFKCIFLNENIWIPIKISLKFVPKSSINNIPALIQIMAWRRPGDKPLSEPLMVNLPTHICVTRPQWVNSSPLDKMTAISQTIYSDAFWWLKKMVFD